MSNNSDDIEQNKNDLNTSMGRIEDSDYNSNYKSQEKFISKIYRLFDLDDDEITQHYPIFIFVLSGILIIMHIYSSATYGFDFFGGKITVDEAIELEALNYPRHVKVRLHVYEFITYAFIHVGFYHLLTNVITIFIFGSYIELKYGSIRACAIWIFGIMAASIGYTMIAAVENAQFRVLVGASGGSYCYMGVTVIEGIINPETIQHKSVRAAIVAFVFLLHLIEYITQYVVNDIPNLGESIAIMAHLFGLLYGLFGSIVFIPNYVVHHHETVFVAASIIFNIFFFIACPLIIIFI